MEKKSKRINHRDHREIIVLKKKKNTENTEKKQKSNGHGLTQMHTDFRKNFFDLTTIKNGMRVRESVTISENLWLIERGIK